MDGLARRGQRRVEHKPNRRRLLWKESRVVVQLRTGLSGDLGQQLLGRDAVSMLPKLLSWLESQDP